MNWIRCGIKVRDFSGFENVKLQRRQDAGAPDVVAHVKVSRAGKMPALQTWWRMLRFHGLSRCRRSRRGGVYVKVSRAGKMPALQ
jgi:hypothetical protein